MIKGAKLRHYMEYYSLRAVVACLRLLSFKRASAIGGRLGLLVHALGIRRDVVERQVRAAFPGLAELEVLRISRASYESLGRTTIETAMFPTLTPATFLELFESVDAWSVVERTHAAGRGILFVAGHLGNWELTGSLVACMGVRVEAVARGMENPVFDAYLTETRSRIGVTVMHDSEAVRRVPRLVRDGKAVGFLVDQGAAGLASTWVPFFGRLAKTPRGPAVFALRLDAPVVFGCVIRQPNSRFIMHFEEVVVERTGDRETDINAIVAAYTATLERWVRRYPEQYFWQHRRWKHQQPGTPPELGDPL